MELRTIDPRKLKANPNNPRRTAASPQADGQLLASVQARGIIQPPLVKITGTTGKSVDVLTIDAGHRRVAAAIKAGLKEILVLVEDAADEQALSDPMNAITENLVRAEMGPVDRWRAMESLAGAGYTDDAIAVALGLTPRNIAQLRLLAKICQPMLDRMAQGDMPNERELRTIASAETDEQLAVWKKNKPKRTEQTSWYVMAEGLTKRKLSAKQAKFGADEAAAFGIVWTEDLFAPADEDSRTTTQVDAFLEAQQAWLEANLPENGTVLAVDTYGRPVLPKGAVEHYGRTANGDMLGHYVNGNTGEVRTVTYAMPEKRRATDVEPGSVKPVPKARPDITAKGVAMIGDLRTDALHQALRERPIDDQQLVALLVLALGGRNVEVKSGVGGRSFGNDCARIAERLTQDGVLTTDPDTLRQAARDMLVEVLSCRDNHSASGMGARHAGTAIAADEFLPTMATEDFLPCVSKAALERAALASEIEPGPRAKDTRAALAARFKDQTWIYPAARFAPTPEELEARRNPSSVVAGGRYVGPLNARVIDDNGEGDDEASESGEEPPDDEDVTRIGKTEDPFSGEAGNALAA